MERASEQPDFPLAVRSLETLTEQVGRCQNLPAVDGGLRLAQAFEDMRNDMRDMRNEINRKLDDLDRKVDYLDSRVQDLDQRMIVAERNGAARMENSSAMRADACLAPLLSLETGEEIPDCPSTMDEADALSSREVDRILRQLGVSTAGPVQDRRRRLLLALGVARRAV
ncbi:hypothetical protein CP533_4915 [Ophiocordyceps camponoti-saundersi (nom. inval.)]|nr:hypothetical protein CP533_4915 [Ophiocordyceps camponoti-saundersi (nom. inval.)]